MEMVRHENVATNQNVTLTSQNAKIAKRIVDGGICQQSLPGVGATGDKVEGITGINFIQPGESRSHRADLATVIDRRYIRKPRSSAP